MKMSSGLLLGWTLCAALSTAAGAQTRSQEQEVAIASCLKAWGAHPFGVKPKYRTIGTSAKVFGIGQNQVDSLHTDKPALVLVNNSVNVMGGTTLELLNPNGWYCFRSNVNVMGSFRIRAQCSAHLASSRDGATVIGSNSDSRSVTVLGSTKIELVGCP